MGIDASNKKGYKNSQLSQKEVLNHVYLQMKQAVELEKSGDKEATNIIVDDLKQMIKNMQAECHTTIPHVKNIHENFDGECLPAPGCVLAQTEEILLRAFSDRDYEGYMGVAYECSCMKSAFKEEKFVKMLWESCMEEKAAYYAVIDKSSEAFVGYCAIKDLTALRWELAIELFEKFRNRGYGYRGVSLLFDELYRLTGRNVFRSRVDPDNYASQALMKRLGGVPDGISEMLLHGEELQKFQQENKDLIDENLSKVAQEFCVEPEDLLGRVLEYRIEWPSHSCTI